MQLLRHTRKPPGNEGVKQATGSRFPTYILMQRFPTGGSRTLGVPKQDFEVSELLFLRVKV